MTHFDSGIWRYSTIIHVVLDCLFVLHLDISWVFCAYTCNIANSFSVELFLLFIASTKKLFLEKWRQIVRINLAYSF
jgi:hypothetical protein